MLPKVITISGMPGCGKTTAAKLLAAKLGYSFLDAGQAIREKAKQHNMTLQEFEKNILDHNPDIDKEIEQWLADQCRNSDKLVLQARMSGWMCHLNNIPAFKIWLYLDKEESYKRIAERENISLDEAKYDSEFRQKSVVDRYKIEYNIDYNDTSIYDYKLETTMSPEDVVNEIIKNLPNTPS